MSPPDDVLRDLPAQLRWWPGPGPGPATDRIDMEWLIRLIDDPALRNQLIVLRLEATAQVMRIAADTNQKAAGLISSSHR
jgi:hypothetical protein